MMLRTYNELCAYTIGFSDGETANSSGRVGP